MALHCPNFQANINVNFLCTSLNPVPDAQVCVYLTVHITKLQLQTTFPKPLYIPHCEVLFGGIYFHCFNIQKKKITHSNFFVKRNGPNRQI